MSGLSDLRDRIVDIKKMSGSELTPNKRNWRVHPFVQRRGVESTLQSIGVADVLKAYYDENGILTLLDGHLRTDVAPDFNWTVLILDFTEDEAIQFLLTYDPLAGMAEADKKLLDGLLKDFESEDEYVRDLVADIAESYGLTYGLPDGLTDIPIIPPERADEIQEKWGVEPGDLWIVDSKTSRLQHRVLCGDSLADESTSLVMAGAQAHICWTDPPYNVALGKSKNTHYTSRPIANDDLGKDFPAFVEGFVKQIHRALLPGAILYLTMGSQEWPTVDFSLKAAKFHWSSSIIWVKQHFVLSRKDYHSQFEPMWYGWKSGDGDEPADFDIPENAEEFLQHYVPGYDVMWYGWKRGASHLRGVSSRKQSDVWFLDRPTSSPEHPTMKPIELVERALHNSSRPGNIVFDPFLGSGTTLCVAERLAMAGRGIELEPKYCAVTLERLSLMGCEAKLAD